MVIEKPAQPGHANYVLNTCFARLFRNNMQDSRDARHGCQLRAAIVCQAPHSPHSLTKLFSLYTHCELRLGSSLGLCGMPV